ncbi:MAG TPA: prepilin-type N-terminal cleavage/methylation domain-containing protein [Kiritimatiellia bacterium]|nr:prepilin-type N-terminal cleavage/methylation domain-containing protein [Kiritimatiellia bacterium]
MTWASRNSAKRRAGFSLVELLVVVAVLGGLLALLSPALQSAMTAGRLTTCQSNLRQVGVGVIAYVQENGGMMPPKDPTNWVINGATVGYPQFSDFIAPYIQAKETKRHSVWRCPADRRFKGAYNLDVKCSYGINIHSIPSEYGNALPYSYSAIARRSQVILLGETTGWGSGSDREVYWGPVAGINTVNMEFRHPRSRPGETDIPTPAPTLDELANATANVLFYDGHVENRSYSSLVRGNFRD